MQCNAIQGNPIQGSQPKAMNLSEFRGATHSKESMECERSIRWTWSMIGVGCLLCYSEGNKWNSAALAETGFSSVPGQTSRLGDAGGPGLDGDDWCKAVAVGLRLFLKGPGSCDIHVSRKTWTPRLQGVTENGFADWSWMTDLPACQKDRCLRPVWANSQLASAHEKRGEGALESSTRTPESLQCFAQYPSERSSSILLQNSLWTWIWLFYSSHFRKDFFFFFSSSHCRKDFFFFFSFFCFLLILSPFPLFCRIRSHFEPWKEQ